MVSLLIWLLIMAGCFYYGIIYENTAIISIGYVLILLMLFSVIEVLYRVFTLKCRLEIPITMAEKSVPVAVELKFVNKGVLATGRIDVCLYVRKTFEKKGSKRWSTFAQIRRKQSLHSLKIKLEGTGEHEIRLAKLRIYSMLGLVSITKKIKDTGTVLILPELHSTQLHVTEATRNFMGDADVYDEFRPGHDSGETFEIREYRQKDKLQSIHWKLSAKSKDLMVRESSLPRACAIVVLMDIRTISRKNIDEYMDGFWQLAASISYCLMDAKTPYYVAWFSRETGDVRRIRVDDEESFYIFLNVVLRDAMTENSKDIRDEYRNKYKNEWYLHDICVNNLLEVYHNGALAHKLNVKKIKDECEKMELLL